MSEYIVQRGDSLSAIARAHGLRDWQTLYNAPENEAFRRLRPNPNVIHPGDRIQIPGESPYAPDEGENGLSGDEDLPHEEDPEESHPSDASLADEARATAVCRVCRNLWNTIDARPNGYAWFSA